MRFLIVLILGLCLPLAALAAGLADVQKVYLLPMTSGLDQYLAERLTSEGVFTVVVDPKQAQAVLTDRVDPALGETLNELYPHEKKEHTKKAEGEAAAKRSAARGRGTLFLVGTGSRQVLWSTFVKLQDRSSEGLHRAARDIVKQLKKDLAAK